MTGNGFVVAVIGLGAAGLWLLAGFRDASVAAVGAAVLLGSALVWRLAARERPVPVLKSTRVVLPRGEAVELSVELAGSGRPIVASGRLSAFGVTRPLILHSRHPAQLKIPADRRGVHRIVLGSMARHDPFELCRVPGDTESVVDLAVTPRWLPFADADVWAASDEDGDALTGSFAGGPLYAGVRAYEPGDDVRLIQWAATARSPDGTTFVRHNVPSRRSLLMVLLDPECEPGASGASPDLLDLAVDVAYSLMGAADPAVLVTAVEGVPEDHVDSRSVTRALTRLGECAAGPGPDHSCLQAIAGFGMRRGAAATVTVIVSASRERAVAAAERLPGRARCVLLQVVPVRAEVEVGDQLGRAMIIASTLEQAQAGWAQVMST